MLKHVHKTSSEQIQEITSCFYYEGVLKKCVRAFKYQKRKGMINVFKKIMDGVSATADIIVPVPIHRTRLLARGFNQSEMIAKKLSGSLSIPITANTLLKIKNTPPQMSLSKSERMKNLKGSLGVKNTALVRGRHILLVDDVTTTGATLDAAAIELYKVGAKQVSAFTLARVK